MSVHDVRVYMIMLCFAIYLVSSVGRACIFLYSSIVTVHVFFLSNI